LPRFKDIAGCPHQSAAVAPHTIVVDVRTMALWRRLPLILSAFDGLAPGDAIELVVDLDPWPLRSYFDTTRSGQCDWQALESGPKVWRVRVSRRA
jgi:uncharacterized protein (DUF2249 family)